MHYVIILTVLLLSGFQVSTPPQEPLVPMTLRFRSYGPAQNKGANIESKRPLSSSEKGKVIKNILLSYFPDKRLASFRTLRQETEIYTGDNEQDRHRLLVSATAIYWFPSKSVIVTHTKMGATFNIINGLESWQLMLINSGGSQQKETVKPLVDGQKTAQISALKYSLFALLWKLNNKVEINNLEFYRDGESVVISIPVNNMLYEYHFSSTDWLCSKHLVRGRPELGAVLYQGYRDAGGIILPFRMQTTGMQINGKNKVASITMTTVVRKYHINNNYQSSSFSPQGVRAFSGN